VVRSLNEHPLPLMLEAGLNATIHTDDPSISQITLSDEFIIAHHGLSLSIDQIRERILAAAQAAFLLDGERGALIRRLEAAFQVQA